jgi:hypothetical protein
MLAETVNAVNESHFVEWMVVVSTAALCVISLALTWVTYLVHKDAKEEHKTSVSALSHDNDNMYQIAKDEMDYHHKHTQAVRDIKRIRYNKGKPQKALD